jgi:hypothetical protein
LSPFDDGPAVEQVERIVDLLYRRRSHSFPAAPDSQN